MARENDMPINIGVMAPYGAIAPGQTGDEEKMLAVLTNLSRDDALFACARVNTYANGFDLETSHTERQRALAQGYCDPEQLKNLDSFAREHGGITKIAVFFEGQILELVRWVAKFCVPDPNDGETFNDPKLRADFVSAALIASDLWNARVYGNKLSSTDTPEANLRKALGAFRKGGEQSGHAEHTGVAMARAWLMFTHYLPRRMPGFADLFERATGLSFKGYFMCILAIMQFSFPKSATGPIFGTEYIQGTNDMREKFASFMALRSQTPDELAQHLWDSFAKSEYRPLRSRPIIRTSHGNSMILDPIYFTESLTVGPLFDLLELKDHREVFGAFGKAFEDYILDFLREMFPGPPHPGTLCPNVEGANAKGEEFECDAIMTDVFDAFVMEIKASWIREDVVLTSDPSDLVEEFRKKYGVSSLGGDKSDRKGVAQLARSIGAIARREWSGVENDLAEIKRIFPVLIVHDQRVSFPGAAPWLDLEFQKLLGPIPSNFRVERLIVLTVADVENLSSSIRRFGFANFFRDYTAQVKGRDISVLNWMYQSKYSELTKRPERLFQTMDAIMQSVREELNVTVDNSAIPQI